MPNFKISAKAKNDLIAIAKNTEKRWGREQRRTYLKSLDNAFHSIAKRPSIGKSCDFIKVGYRRYPQGSHVIFYRLNNQAVIEIIRVLHKRMDYLSKLS